jgi:hypothetical protein
MSSQVTDGYCCHSASLTIRPRSSCMTKTGVHNSAESWASFLDRENLLLQQNSDMQEQHTAYEYTSNQSLVAGSFVFIQSRKSCDPPAINPSDAPSNIRLGAAYLDNRSEHKYGPSKHQRLHSAFQWRRLTDLASCCG